MRKTILAALVLCSVAGAYQAQASTIITCDNRFGCSSARTSPDGVAGKRAGSHHFKGDARPARSYSSDTVTVIGGAPSGCPRVAFCACAMSVEVFGHSIRALWPARAWYRFARTHQRPGAIGVRPHHVLKLISQVSGNTWLVFDPNSGGHLSRVHERDVRGYTFVDPTSQRLAEVAP